MQINNFLNICISVHCIEIVSHFKKFFKLLNIKHGESSYSHKLTTYKVQRGTLNEWLSLTMQFIICYLKPYSTYMNNLK